MAPRSAVDAAGFPNLSSDALALAESGKRAEVSKDFFHALESADLADLLKIYRDFLAACQFDLGMAFIQPGRLIHGFDDLAAQHAFCPLPPGHRFEADMSKRFQLYVDDLVRPFYTNHFASFDRQVVLVDLLTCLNAGPDHFADTQRALSAILESFAYGQNSWLRHLFAPRIEKVLFAASKADHVAANSARQS